VRVAIVRHARAGDRAAWNGDDLERPLGVRQAAALPGLLADQPVTRIVSSPALRCTGTVEPLGHARGVAVEQDPCLLEDADPEAALGLVLGDASDGLVLCTHGGLLTPMLDALAAAGAPVQPRKDGKGAVWLLEVEAGRVVDARYLPPPA
jgi:phosphohistidine phosphatase SixA